MKLARAALPIAPRRGWRPCLRRKDVVPHAARARWLPLVLLWRRRRAAMAVAPIVLHRRGATPQTTRLDLRVRISAHVAGFRTHTATDGATASPPAARRPGPAPSHTIWRTAGAASDRAIPPTGGPAKVAFRAIAVRGNAPAARDGRPGAADARAPREQTVWRSARRFVVAEARGRADPTTQDGPLQRSAIRAEIADGPAMLVHRAARPGFAPDSSGRRSAAPQLRAAPARLRAPELVWREPTSAAAQADAAGDLAFAAASAPATAPAAMRQSAPAAAGVAAAVPDRAAVDRIAREVIGRVEKHIRIERERRGV